MQYLHAWSLIVQVPKGLDAGTIEFENVKFFYPFRPEVCFRGAQVSHASAGAMRHVYLCVYILLYLCIWIYVCTCLHTMYARQCRCYIV